jgi:hypothetical protein
MPKVCSFVFFFIFKLFIDIDYTYTRNKFDTVPSPSTNNTNLMDGNDPVKRQEEASKLVVWFNHEDKYSQGSFILSILQWCDSYLIFTIALNIFSLQDMDCKLVSIEEKFLLMKCFS